MVVERAEEPRGIATAAVLCGLASDLGVDPATCLRGTRITPASLQDPAAEVTIGQELRLIANLVGALDDPEGAGLEAGRRYRLTTYGIWSFALMSSVTVRDAMEIATGFIDLTWACATITAAEHAEGLVVRYDDWDVPEPVRRFVLERETAATVTILREGLASDLAPRTVELRLPVPRRPEPYRAAFGRLPIFDAPHSRLVLDPALLDRPMPQGSELTAKALVAQCRELLERRHARRGVSGRVRDELLRDVRAMPSQEELAEKLHVSVRTLRRQLADEGTSYRTLVEQTRQILAEELLATGRLTVEQVADRVGYAETSSFVHAFRRWNGTSPRRWAKDLRSG